MDLRSFIGYLSPFNISHADIYELASYLSGVEYSLIKSVGDPVIIDDDRAFGVFERLKNCEPVAYITNRREFFSDEFYIDSRVLIPRLETEILVEQALKLLAGKESPKILDLCTGSGCILLSILKNIPDATGVGIDISNCALEVASINADKFSLKDRAEFISADARTYKNNLEIYDLITCNPPYIADDEYQKLEAQVRYEPISALVAADSGLEFYKKILWNISLLCKTCSAALFEIGYDQGGTVSEIADGFGINNKIINDYAGHSRVLACIL